MFLVLILKWFFSHLNVCSKLFNPNWEMGIKILNETDTTDIQIKQLFFNSKKAFTIIAICVSHFCCCLKFKKLQFCNKDTKML